jgi:hypothetical protein
MNIKRLLLLISLTLCSSLSGCVERQLTINTNPAGAQVLLNDEEVGVSPVTTTFSWYGDYNVSIRKEGYQTLTTHQKLQAPWYDYFPFDFVTDVLYPGHIIASYQWSFDLSVQKEIDRQELINSAQQLAEPNNL